MKSRLDGYKSRRGDRSFGASSSSGSGARLWELVVFWAITLLFVAVLFIPENPFWRFKIGSKAPDDYIARVSFTITDPTGEPQVFSKGDTIIGKGMVVDNEMMAQITAENNEWKAESGNWKWFLTRAGGVTIIVIASLALFIVFSFHLIKLPKPEPLRLLFLGAIFASAFLCGRLFALLLPSVYWLLTPLALAAAISAVTIRIELSATATICSTPIVLLTYWPFHEISIAIIAGAVIAPFVTQHARKRNHLLRAGLIIGAVNMVVVFAFGIVAGTDITQILLFCVAGLTGGIATGAIITVLLPVIEWLFGVVTDISLLELSDLNHPLLRRLLLEAPGTYQHSLLVATISETAAESIGANALLCKVGSLFHDIGKLVRPKYFVENNPTAPGMHSKLKYSLSAMLIISHVKDGAELGREFNLPKPIVDIIFEHQGTTLVEYFYRKALEDKNSLALPDEQFFQYPGPKPLTKEAAIVMIADSVEAVARTLKDPSLKRIQDAVHNIVFKKLTEGQFDQCDITLAELKTIEERIAFIVRSMFHQRIEYPGQRSQLPSPENAMVKEG